MAAPGGNSFVGAPLPPPAGRDVFVWATCSQTSVLINCSTMPIFIVGAQGTSMSAPHVAGAAALLVPIIGRNPAQIKQRILGTSDRLEGKGRPGVVGEGRLNVARAVGVVP